MGEMLTDTVRDVKQLPSAPAAAAAFPAKRVLLPLCLAQFMNSYDTSAMNVAISNIVSDLDTTVTAVQTALSLYTLVMAAGMITGSNAPAARAAPGRPAIGRPTKARAER